MVAVIRFSAESSLATKSVNVWHYRIPGANSVSETEAAMNAVDNFYEAVKTFLSAGLITIGPTAQTVDFESNIYITAGAPETVTTTGTPTGVLALAMVINFRSAFVGPDRRGRVYLGPLDEDLITDGRTIDPGAIATAQTAVNALIADTTSGIELGVWSRAKQAFTPYTTATVRPLVGIQRRRLS